MPIPHINPKLMSAAARANLERLQQASLGIEIEGSPIMKNGLREETKKALEKKSENSKQKWSGAQTLPTSDVRIPKGAKFGMLTVVDVGRTVAKRKISLCQCECGTYTVVQNCHLMSGHTTNCGCKHLVEDVEKKKAREKKYSHPLYKAWDSVKYRCNNPNACQYHNYGARGIKVCQEWEHSYKSFHDWSIANGWKRGLSIDRIDNDGNYEPSNCRWTDTPTQGRNRRTNVLLTYKGQTKTVAEWAEITGLYYTTIIERIRKGWSAEETIETPKRAYNRGGTKENRKYAKFSLYINPLLLSTGQQKKMNFVTKTIFTDSRVENGMRLVELAAKPHTNEIHRVCPPGTRIALTITFLCPYPASTPLSERIERGLMGEGFDCDNKYKAIGDAFTNAGWWPDDRYVTSLMIEKRRTTAMPRIEVIVEPDIIREPSLMSSEELLEDEPILVDTDIDEEEDFSLFSAVDTNEANTVSNSQTINPSAAAQKPSETNPLSDLLKGEPTSTPNERTPQIGMQ